MPGPGQNCVMLLIYFSNVRLDNSSIGNHTEAISGEDHEYESMIDAVKSGKLKDDEMPFYYPNDVERTHSQLYNKLLSTWANRQKLLLAASVLGAEILRKKSLQRFVQYAVLKGSCSSGSNELCRIAGKVK